MAWWRELVLLLPLLGVLVGVARADTSEPLHVSEYASSCLGEVRHTMLGSWTGHASNGTHGSCDMQVDFFPSGNDGLRFKRRGCDGMWRGDTRAGLFHVAALHMVGTSSSAVTGEGVLEVSGSGRVAVSDVLLPSARELSFRLGGVAVTLQRRDGSAAPALPARNATRCAFPLTPIAEPSQCLHRHMLGAWHTRVSSPRADQAGCEGVVRFDADSVHMALNASCPAWLQRLSRYSGVRMQLNGMLTFGLSSAAGAKDAESARAMDVFSTDAAPDRMSVVLMHGDVLTQPAVRGEGPYLLEMTRIPAPLGHGHDAGRSDALRFCPHAFAPFPALRLASHDLQGSYVGVYNQSDVPELFDVSVTITPGFLLSAAFQRGLANPFFLHVDGHDHHLHRLHLLSAAPRRARAREAMHVWHEYDGIVQAVQENPVDGRMLVYRRVTVRLLMNATAPRTSPQYLHTLEMGLTLGMKRTAVLQMRRQGKAAAFTQCGDRWSGPHCDFCRSEGLQCTASEEVDRAWCACVDARETSTFDVDAAGRRTRDLLHVSEFTQSTREEEEESLEEDVIQDVREVVDIIRGKQDAGTGTDSDDARARSRGEGGEGSARVASDAAGAPSAHRRSRTSNKNKVALVITAVVVVSAVGFFAVALFTILRAVQERRRLAERQPLLQLSDEIGDGSLDRAFDL